MVTRTYAESIYRQGVEISRMDNARRRRAFEAVAEISLAEQMRTSEVNDLLQMIAPDVTSVRTLGIVYSSIRKIMDNDRYPSAEFNSMIQELLDTILPRG